MPSEDRLHLVRITLVAVFVTALVTAQVTAAKVMAFDLPVALPVTGSQVLVPAAAFAYALTFLASDCYAELFGRKPAQAMVNVAFGMNVVFLGLAWLAIAGPVFRFSPVGQEAFASVIGASAPVVIGSMAAYLVSQNWDVVVFHRIRAVTGDRRLWARNLGSTVTSQFLDTVIFITLAFGLLPPLFGGQAMAGGEILALVVGQYVVKLALAAGDTPVVYAVVHLARSRNLVPHAQPADPAPKAD
jgi:uncharacterized integral membrane protein (TIGR00697 family)